MTAFLNARRIALLYALFGAMWILLSDWFVARVFGAKLSETAQTTKGLLFIFVTSVLVYWLVRQGMKHFQRSEIRYRTLFTAANDGVFLIEATPEGMPRTIVDVNQRACDCLQYSREELLQMTVREIVDTKSWERIQPHLDKFKEKDAITFESRHVRKDGSTFPVEISSRLFRLDNRPMIISVVRDISERKQKEEQLGFQATLLNQIQDRITATDMQGNITYVNDAVCQMLGKAAEELIGKNVSVFSEGLTQGVAQEEIIREAAAHGSWRGEVFNRTAEGEEALLDCRVQVVHDESGQPVAMVGLSTDITARKKIEDSLRESEERLRAIFDSTPNMIYMKNRELRYTHCNLALEKFFGVSSEEILGKTDYDFFPEQHASEIEEIDRQTLEGETIRGRYLRQMDGQEVHIETVRSPVKDAGGNIIGLCGISMNITDRVRLRKEKEHLTEQLRQAQKMEAIGQLAGGVAHDFNNLLQVINGNTDMALEEAAPDNPAHEYLQEVSEAGKRAASLVGQLLAFSRRQIMKPVSLNLNTVVADLLKILNRIIGEHIHLDFVPAHQLDRVYADRSMMEQVIMNLCVNARDAMPDGGSLSIETSNVCINRDYCDSHAWATPGRYVLLSLTDTGFGMDKETLEKIFEPFFTTKAKDRGTGLGLATVYGIVKQHDGMIQAYSEPAKGSMFKIYLPVQERLATEVGVNIEGAVEGGQETILVAEDDDMVRHLASRILERAGYRVISVKDGAEAVLIFNRQADEIDLLLLDVVMPNLGGREACERMRQIRPDIPVLFASGYSENAVHTNFILNEGITLLQKPFASDSLLRTVRQVLDEARNKE
jgi:PAS domain S-box-containing protein